jgi:hypothetical protein
MFDIEHVFNQKSCKKKEKKRVERKHTPLASVSSEIMDNP